MTDAAKEDQVVSPLPAAQDLSQQIEQSMERQPDERIKVVRLFDNRYRCNWWVPDKKQQPFWIATGTIRRSRFLRATMTSNGLHIEQVP